MDHSRLLIKRAKKLLNAKEELLAAAETHGFWDASTCNVIHALLNDMTKLQIHLMKCQDSPTWELWQTAAQCWDGKIKSAEGLVERWLKDIALNVAQQEYQLAIQKLEALKEYAKVR